jgi:excisionase family DNA binding protein
MPHRAQMRLLLDQVDGLDEHVLISTEQAAKLLGVGRRAVSDLLRQGRLRRMYEHGRVRLVRRECLELKAAGDYSANANKLQSWMQPRAKRTLATVAEMIRADLDKGLFGKKWNGSRTGIRSADCRDRMDIALATTLGLYAITPDKRLICTDQGQAVATAAHPKPVLQQQLLRYQYPSPYSRRVRIDSSFEIHPYWFLLHVLTDTRLADSQGLFITEGNPAVHRSEVAAFIVHANRDESVANTVSAIVRQRLIGFPTAENYYLPIANTFINNLESVGLIVRRDGGMLIQLAPLPHELQLQIMGPGPDFIPYSLGSDYQFQLNMGRTPEPRLP